MSAYYNENDPYCAEWLANLIGEDLIAPGDVDSRSILDVVPADLDGYTQAHFFAGIGGWSYALRLAGWPDDRAAWTGSCPCQPFSVAGKRAGAADVRHLWPEFHRLIRERGPRVVFGEQVAGAAGLGWLDGISADLEAGDYAVGTVVLGAHSVGAPHIRRRVFWVADAGRLGNERRGGPSAAHGETGGAQGKVGQRQRRGSDTRDRGPASGRAADVWGDFVVVACSDGKARRIGAGVRPVADGVPDRVPQLRAFGNAIVPQVAAEFVSAYMDLGTHNERERICT